MPYHYLQGGHTTSRRASNGRLITPWMPHVIWTCAFTELQVGSLCLAKQTEGNNLVWLPAEILHLEEGLVTVQMKSVNQTLALPFDDIFPLGDDDNDTSSDDDDDEEDDRPIKLTFDDDDEEEHVVREIKINDDLRWIPRSGGSSVGLQIL
jgi:hypothetical protein